MGISTKQNLSSAFFRSFTIRKKTIADIS